MTNSDERRKRRRRTPRLPRVAVSAFPTIAASGISRWRPTAGAPKCRREAQEQRAPPAHRPDHLRARLQRRRNRVHEGDGPVQAGEPPPVPDVERGARSAPLARLPPRRGSRPAAGRQEGEGLRRARQTPGAGCRARRDNGRSRHTECACYFRQAGCPHEALPQRRRTERRPARREPHPRLLARDPDTQITGFGGPQDGGGRSRAAFPAHRTRGDGLRSASFSTCRRSSASPIMPSTASAPRSPTRSC